jgi:Zn2+/Cd2+-exporting ATPase
MNAITKHVWHVAGMDCASCVAKVTKAVERLPGVSDVEVNLMAERLSLTLAAVDGASPDAVVRQVEGLGYTVRKSDPSAAAGRPSQAPHAHASGEADHHHGHDHRRNSADSPESSHPFEPDLDPSWYESAKARTVFLLGALVAGAFAASHVVPEWSYWLYLAATLAALVPFGRRAIALARAGSPFSIETLMCVAAIGAVAIGAAAESALVVLLFAIGELLEGVAAGRARAGIRSLVAMMPRTALRRRRDGSLEEVPAEILRRNDTVLVRPGERLPCDGTIVEGQSALDESPVTGESQPVSRGPGDSVVAGSVNANVALVVRVTETGADSTLARIARLVQDAAASRGATQRFIERFSAIWTPAAMVLAILVMAVPPLLFGGEWSVWVYRGLAVLLVACPCALVISVPAAMASGLSAGARNGLLVKGGAALEAIGSARVVAFDKTGTLTRGKPKVTDVLSVAGASRNAVVALAAAVEANSSHPLAKALVEEARKLGVAIAPSSEATAIPGKGVVAKVEGRSVGVGSPSWAAEDGRTIGPEFADARDELEKAGKTVAFVYVDGRPFGIVAFRDEPRDDAAEGVARLRDLGVSAVMLTGDNPRTGAAIAGGLGMKVLAGLSPARKLEEIQAMRRDGVVAMVGDGINDAPALAAANVGIAMGGGTAVALESADAAIMRDRVAGVSDLVELSRATLANVKQNVAIAIGLKLVFLLTTVAGITGLWPAILADTGATVLVTLNALRLLRWKVK